MAEETVKVKKMEKNDPAAIAHAKQFRKDQIEKVDVVQREGADGKIKYIKKTRFKNGVVKSEVIAMRKVGAKNADRDGFIYKKEDVEI